MSNDEPSARIPPPAALLGAAGLIPFMGLAVAGHLAPEPWRLPALTALSPYGALILSFMGGAQWGLAVAAGERRLRPYAVSVIPALLAWALLAAGGARRAPAGPLSKLGRQKSLRTISPRPTQSI